MTPKKVMRTVTVTLCTVALLLTGVYGYAVFGKKPLDDEARKTASGRFVRLSQGLVNYEMTGPEAGPVVVLISGTTTPFFIWDKHFPILAESGFRVIRFDHYGKGFSDRPDGRYDRRFYDRMLLELLDSLGVRAPVHLIGLSLGGAIAMVFADRHAGRVRSISLIAPTGFPIREPFAHKLSKIPVIGDVIMAAAGDRALLKGIRKTFMQPDRFPEFVEKFRPQLAYRGYHRVLLATLRHMRMHHMGEVYERVGKLKKPMLLIWGRNDHVLPFANSGRVVGAIPHIKFHPVPGAGHNLVYEHPETVHPILTDFLHQAE